MKKVVCIFLIALFVFPLLSSFAVVSFLAGDVDGNGKLAPEDARLTLRASVGLEDYLPGSYGFIAADINNDGFIKPDDARSILRAAVGLEMLPGKIITDSGEIKTTVAYIDKKTGEVVATTAAPTATTRPVSTTAPHEINTTKPYYEIITTLPSYETNTTVPAQPANPTANEFDYLRSGNFYIQGTMTDSSGQQLPLEMAVTANSVYMLSNFKGAEMGMLINDGTTYMIYPAEKSYLELSSAVLKAMGMSTDALISSADLDYSQYDLSKADSITTENVNGKNCTVYIYNNTSGSTRFFMDGNNLVRIATYDAKGDPNIINDITYITNNVPADKINPPADYKEYKGLTGMFSYISLLGDEDEAIEEIEEIDAKEAIKEIANLLEDIFRFFSSLVK